MRSFTKIFARDKQYIKPGKVFSKEGSNLDLDQYEYFLISMQIKSRPFGGDSEIQRAQSFLVAWET